VEQSGGVIPGNVVVLNGVSSAGKTTLATAFRDEQARSGDFWLLVGIDDALAKLPSQWVDLGLAMGPGAHRDQGLHFERTAAGQRFRVGPLARQLIDVYHQWVSAAVRSGMNVIVDDVVVDRATYESWLRVLDGLQPIWVGVRCAVEIAEARELARGDRAIGLARAQHDVVHRDIPYAFEIDTGALDPSEALAAFRRGLGC
jgi:chloramphenicol 3-O phosphotransferase